MSYSPNRFTKFKIYIGEHDDNSRILKIGYTEHTCWYRCKNTDYHIFAAAGLLISHAEALFIESYVRLAFNAMDEVDSRFRQDYFIMKKDLCQLASSPNQILPKCHSIQNDDFTSWGADWLFTFIGEAVEIINRKRDFTNTPHVECIGQWEDYVSPYSY